VKLGWTPDLTPRSWLLANLQYKSAIDYIQTLRLP